MEKYMTKIIGICGSAGSGKDTLAQQLIQNGYEKIAFADTLKDILSVVFGWDRSSLEGNTPETRAWREKPDTWWENKLNWSNMENLTLRSLFPRFTPVSYTNLTLPTNREVESSEVGAS